LADIVFFSIASSFGIKKYNLLHFTILS